MENHIHFTKSSAVCSTTIMNPALHDFRSMVDGEMKHLNATGNYIVYVNKQQTQPITVEQENRLGFARGLQCRCAFEDTSISSWVFLCIKKWEWTQVMEAFSFPNSAGKRAYLVYCEEDVSQTNQGGYVIWYLHVMCYLPLAISFTIICVSENIASFPPPKEKKAEKNRRVKNGGGLGTRLRKIHTQGRTIWPTNKCNKKTMLTA